VESFECRAPDPQPSANAAASAFLALDGYPAEFVDDLGEYSRVGDEDAMSFTTGEQPEAVIGTVLTSGGWIVAVVELTCL